MNSVLITGASGFIGRALCENLLTKGWNVCATLRSLDDKIRLPKHVHTVLVPSIDSDTNWDKILTDIDTVVHLAARTHILLDTSSNPLFEYRRINVDGTRCLATAAAKNGVKRFVYISSVKVNGEENNIPYKEKDEPAPVDNYGISKMEGETVLKEIASCSDMDTVIIRPPLVYGPGVKANFLRLLNLVYHRIPLPFGNIKNRRSLVYIGNLIDCIAVCLEHPKAVGQTFLISDDKNLSTESLIATMAKAMGRTLILYPIPRRLIKMAGRLTGKTKEINRLTNSLCVDIGKIKKQLDWIPPYTVEQGIKETCNWFMENQC